MGLCSCCGKLAGCFKSFSVKYLFFINIIIGVLGVASIAFAGYLWSQLGDLAAGLNEYTILGPIIVGVFLLLATIIGYCGLKKRSKILLFVYFLLVLVVFAVLASAGFILLIYSGKIPDTGFESYVSDFEGSIYNKCCVDAGYTVDTVPLCADNDIDGCITDAIGINDAICEFLEDLSLKDSNGDSVKVVGNTTLGGCGGVAGSVGFREMISDFLTSNFELIGGVQVGIVALLGLTLLASCAVACGNKDEFKEKQQKKKAAHQDQVSANKLV